MVFFFISLGGLGNLSCSKNRFDSARWMAGFHQCRNTSRTLVPDSLDQNSSLLGILGKAQLLSRAILEALEILDQQRGPGIRQAVHHPLGTAFAIDHPQILHVAQLLGNPDLIDLQQFDQMADTERALLKQIQNPKTQLVTQTLVNPDALHGAYIPHVEYAVKRIS
jgi:hypothetical protein